MPPSFVQHFSNEFHPHQLQDQFNQCKIEMGQTQHVLEQSCFTIEGQEQLLDDMRRDIASNRETIANLMAENATKDARSAMLSTQLDSLRLLLANTQESLRMHQGLAKQADLYACQLQLQYDDILGKYTNGQEQLKAQNSKLDEAIRAISEMKIK
jgi:chromosome segregation ATPase